MTNMIKNSPIIVVRNLSKSFGAVKAVKNVDFFIRQGELFGFLGPNGAGKTTTINMLRGLAKPDSGQIIIDGIDCTKKHRATQHLIGVVPDESNLYPELSGYDNLCFCAALYGMKKEQRRQRARELLDYFGLGDASERKFSDYSKGMKRKLTIAAGIIHQPKILFLDEPTTGIDVASARQLRQLIDDLHGKGTTIFLTTHYIEEAERLCDRIAFIVDGKIVRVDSVENLLQPVRDKHVLHISFSNMLPDIEKKLAKRYPDLTFLSQKPGLIYVESNRPIHAGPLVRFLEDEGGEVTEARKVRPSLEDIFVIITGIKAHALQKEKEKNR
jgi:ABC-2 type transport system ATP-binding protein